MPIDFNKNLIGSTQTNIIIKLTTKTGSANGLYEARIIIVRPRYENIMPHVAVVDTK